MPRLGPRVPGARFRLQEAHSSAPSRPIRRRLSTRQFRGAFGVAPDASRACQRPVSTTWSRLRTAQEAPPRCETRTRQRTSTRGRGAGTDWIRRRERRCPSPLPACRQRPTLAPDAHSAHSARPLPARRPADRGPVHGLRASTSRYGLVRHRSGRQLRGALRAAVVRVVEDLDSDVTLAGESIGATLSLTASSGPRRSSTPHRRLQHLRLRRRRQAGQLLRAPGDRKHPGSGDGPNRPPREQADSHALRGGGRTSSSSARPLPRRTPSGRAPRIPDSGEGDPPQPGQHDPGPRTIRAHHRPCDSRLWRPRLVADSDRKANIESVPGARYIELRDTGHFTALEAPHEVERILRNVAPGGRARWSCFDKQIGDRND